MAITFSWSSRLNNVIFAFQSKWYGNHTAISNCWQWRVAEGELITKVTAKVLDQDCTRGLCAYVPCCSSKTINYQPLWLNISLMDPDHFSSFSNSDHDAQHFLFDIDWIIYIFITLPPWNKWLIRGVVASTLQRIILCIRNKMKNQIKTKLYCV